LVHARRENNVGVGPRGFPHLPSVVSEDGVRWVDYRRTLTPRYGVVWRDITVTYVFLLVGLATATAAERFGWPPWVVVAVTAVWSGYWLHSLFLFGHEAAHRNLAPTRRANDRLGDWLVWLLFGSTTRNYRRTHMAHHAHLGDHGDSETTYHLCMSVLNMLKATVGLHVLEVLLRKAKAERKTTRESGVLASARSAVAHLAVVVGLWSAGAPVVALSWVIGVVSVFPLLATVRTIVEHRRADAACDVDFTTTRHGAVNRMFGTGVIARYFGSAGFNRHLLHHWDPAISYTRFDEMERFFSATPLAAEMDASRTSYGAAVKTLMAEARRG
jgi:fatty acid desaturase